MKDTDVIWCVKVRNWGGGRIPLQHLMSAERWANSINMWPNAVLTFNHHSGVQIVHVMFSSLPMFTTSQPGASHANHK